VRIEEPLASNERLPAPWMPQTITASTSTRSPARRSDTRRPGRSPHSTLAKRSPSLSPVATVIPIDDLRRSARAALFEGRDDVPVSIFVTQYERGQGPSLHLHPYPEVFVVQTGTAVFTAGDEELTVTAGHIVVVPARTPHGFKSAGEDTLHVVSVHPSATVQQTDL